MIIIWPSISSFIELGQNFNAFQIYNNLSYFEFYFVGGPFPIGIFFLILRIILCAYGAAIGDLIGSFLKRRFNYKSGAPFWIVDQLDFVIIALIFVSIPAIFFPNLYLVPDINIIIFLMIKASHK